MYPPASGPATMATAIIAAMYPWYRPRSRGGTRSPMIAIAPTSNPPAPSPCNARNPISCPMVCAAPDSAEPARKTTIEVRNTPLRPYRSPTLPHSGVETVVPRT